MRASFQYYKRHFFTGALKCFLKFLEQFQKKNHAEAAVVRCLHDRSPEKILKLYKETPMLESLFKKVSRNKKIPAQVVSRELCEAFKNNFFTKYLWWSWSLSFKKFYVQEFTKRFLNDQQQTNLYLIVWNFFIVIAKTILAISISCFSIFSITIFFY